MAELFWSRRALASVRSIDDYISERNPDGARNVLAEIDRSCSLLAEFPMIGVTVPETFLRCHVTRRYRYRIIYRVEGERVEIRDVMHPSQDR